MVATTGFWLLRRVGDGAEGKEPLIKRLETNYLQILESTNVKLTSELTVLREWQTSVEVLRMENVFGNESAHLLEDHGYNNEKRRL